MSVRELFALKRVFGVSAQAIAYRCKDLGIIGPSTCTGLFERWRGVHILRHTFRSRCGHARPARATQELAGHVDESMTERYMHPSPAALDAAIRLLDKPAGPVRVKIHRSG